MAQDFMGQNLKGRSFKGRDLTGANFESADIRGADFSNAILRGANFSNVKAGLRLPWLILIVGIGLLLVAVGLLVETTNIANMAITSGVLDGLEIPDKILDGFKNVTMVVAAIATVSGAILVKLAIAFTTQPATRKLFRNRLYLRTVADVGVLAYLVTSVLLAVSLKNVLDMLDLWRTPSSYAAGFLDDSPFSESAGGIYVASFSLLIGAIATTVFSGTKTRSRNKAAILIAAGVGVIAARLIGILGGLPLLDQFIRSIVSLFFIVASFPFFPPYLLFASLPFIGNFVVAVFGTVGWALFGAFLVRVRRINAILPLIMFIIGFVLAGVNMMGWQSAAFLLAIALIAVVCSFVVLATESTSFRGADLSNANFQKAALRYTDFTKATLENTDFSKAEV
jgi:uncharacterized protein YjbI with pentapeptide repeats